MQPISQNQAARMFIKAHNQLLSVAQDHSDQLPESTEIFSENHTETLILNDAVQIGDRTYLPGTRISSDAVSAKSEEIKYQEANGEQVDIKHETSRFLGIYRNESLDVDVAKGFDSVGFSKSKSEIGFPVSFGWIVKESDPEDRLRSSSAFH